MRRWMPLIIVAVTLMLTASAMACPFCKDSLPSSDALTANGVPNGFNNSIYFMFISLFSMMGMVAFTLVRGARTSTGSQPIDPPNDDRGFPLE